MWRADGVGLWVSASRPRPFRASGSPSLSPSPRPRGGPCRNRGERVVGRLAGWLAVKILLRIVCRLRPTAPDVTTGKNRKSPGNRRKNSSGSDPLPPTPIHGSLPSSLSLSFSSSSVSFSRSLIWVNVRIVFLFFIQVYIVFTFSLSFFPLLFFARRFSRME